MRNCCTSCFVCYILPLTSFSIDDETPWHLCVLQLFLQKLSILSAFLSSECLCLAALMLQYVRYSTQRHNKWKNAVCTLWTSCAEADLQNKKTTLLFMSCHFLPVSSQWQGQLSSTHSETCWPEPAPPPPSCPSLRHHHHPAHPGSVIRWWQTKLGSEVDTNYVYMHHLCQGW